MKIIEDIFTNRTISDKLYGDVRYRVRNQISETVWYEVLMQASNPVYRQVHMQINDRVWEQFKDNVYGES